MRPAAADQRGRPAEHRPAGAARRRRRDQPVELPADPVGPGGRPGPRARQRGRAQAGRADRGIGRGAHRPAVRAGRAARRRAARAARRRRARRGAGREPRRGDDLLHRLDRGRPPGRRGRGADAEAGQPRARRQQRADRPRRRRPGHRQLGRRLGGVPAPGPGLHDGRPAHRRGVGRRRLPRAAGQAGGQPAGRRPVHRQVALGRSSTNGSWPTSTASSARRSARARPCGRAAVTRACSTGRPSSAT